MKKRAISLMLAATLLFGILPALPSSSALAASGVSTSSVSGTSVESACFAYLTSELGFNSAAACGVLANIYRESGFRPEVVNSVGSTGLCQWTGGRRTALLEYCDENGFDAYSVEGQMNYLSHELNNSYPDILDYMRNSVENSAAGAYDAGYYWCYYFERPANKQAASATRGQLAQDTFWSNYANATVTEMVTVSKLTITPGNYPTGTMRPTAVALTGTISSNAALISVTGSVVSVNGNVVMSGTVAPGTTSYNLANSGVDSALRFGTLADGYYYLQYDAVDAIESTATWKSPIFAVSSNGSLKVFSDVSANTWYTSQVYALAEDGVLAGSTDSNGSLVFSPDGQLTRAQAIVMLYRMAGSPTPENVVNPYTDATADWYRSALLWAVEKGITTGTSWNTFSPDLSITREQFAVFLYRTCGGYVESCVALQAYTDVSAVDSWATQAVCWCVLNGVLTSASDEALVLSPVSTASRAQAAVMLERAKPLF